MEPPAWSHLHNLPLREIASTVVWVLTRLLTDPAFWAGLAATLLGVVLAFELERWRDRRQARELYARHLNAVRYESAALLAICRQALAAIPKGGITSYEVDAPALRSFVVGPILQEHAPHSLAVVLGSVLTFVGATSNSLDHYRRNVGIAGTAVLAPQLTPLTRHLTRLQTGIEHAQGLLDQEMKRLQRGVIRTAEDEVVIAAFREATKG